MKTIRWFDDIRAGDIEEVGGKGANLGEMARAGLPIPPGYCITTQAYREFVQAAGIGPEIEAILAGLSDGGAEPGPGMPDQGHLETACAGIRDLFVQSDVPVTLEHEIREAYRRLGERMGAASPAVAVRSSANAEDLATASFAGQQDTYLNVVGEGMLLEHVKACWASLWTERAVAYRAQQGFDHNKVYLSVVVQAMVSSEISGVMFTANPVNGDRDVVVINASWGLGEAIVSGLVTPDTLTVEKAGGRVCDRRTASKEIALVYGPQGGVEKVDLPPEKRAAQALSDAQAAELAALGVKIEAHYGRPQDIEWAYAGSWYILQARAVTTLEKAQPENAGSAPVEATEYNRTMFLEIFPDPITPAFASATEVLFKSMLDFTFRTWGFEPPHDIPAIGVFYNQPYFNRTYIETALAPLSPEVRNLLVAQVINPFGDHKGKSQVELSIPYLRMAASTLRFMLGFPKELPGLLDEYHRAVAAVEAQPVDDTTDEELVGQISTMIYGTTRKLVDHDFLLIAVIKRVYHLLGMMLEPYFGKDAEALRGKLISGVTGNQTMRTNTRLWDLAQLAKASIDVATTLQKYHGAELTDRLAESSDGRAFLEEMNKFLKEFGHREVRLEITYPTWKEDPTPVYNFVRSYLDVGSDQDPHLQQQRLMKQRQELKLMVKQRLASDWKGRWIVWPLFRWLLDKIEFHTRERDTFHFEMTRIFPAFRRNLHELGARWMGQGWLSEADQIFFLSLDEMESMTKAPQSMSAVASQRQQEYETNRTRTWPDAIRGGRELHVTGADQTVEDGQLAGVPGSPGVITGRARVICGPEEFHRLEPGEILVAPITNPVWTPLFAIAGGVITEVGGILSHGAIVAREYGIPAVMSISNVTKRVLDGQLLTVDGNRGWVFLGQAGD